MSSKRIITTITILLISIGTSFLILHTRKNDQNITDKEIATCLDIYNELMDNLITKALTLKQTVHRARKGVCIIKNHSIFGIPFLIVEVQGTTDNLQGETYFKVARTIMFLGIPFN